MNWSHIILDFDLSRRFVKLEQLRTQDKKFWTKLVFLKDFIVWFVNVFKSIARLIRSKNNNTFLESVWVVDVCQGPKIRDCLCGNIKQRCESLKKVKSFFFQRVTILLTVRFTRKRNLKTKGLKKLSVELQLSLTLLVCNTFLIVYFCSHVKLNIWEKSFSP